MSLDYNKKNIALAKNLRKNATREEKHLWYDFLSKHEIGFQRQKAIDNFIADFYCHKAKLIIEIDGSQHYTEDGKHKDEYRTEILENYGLKIIRFTNGQINSNFWGVCAYIDAAVKASLREGWRKWQSHGRREPAMKDVIESSPSHSGGSVSIYCQAFLARWLLQSPAVTAPSRREPMIKSTQAEMDSAGCFFVISLRSSL